MPPFWPVIAHARNSGLHLDHQRQMWRTVKWRFNNPVAKTTIGPIGLQTKSIFLNGASFRIERLSLRTNTLYNDRSHTSMEGEDRQEVDCTDGTDFEWLRRGQIRPRGFGGRVGLRLGYDIKRKRKALGIKCIHSNYPLAIFFSSPRRRSERRDLLGRLFSGVQSDMRNHALATNDLRRTP